MIGSSTTLQLHEGERVLGPHHLVHGRRRGAQLSPGRMYLSKVTELKVCSIKETVVLGSTRHTVGSDGAVTEGLASSLEHTLIPSVITSPA